MLKSRHGLASHLTLYNKGAFMTVRDPKVDFNPGCDDGLDGGDGDRAAAEQPVKRVRENGWVRQSPPATSSSASTSQPVTSSTATAPPVPPRGPRQHPGEWKELERVQFFELQGYIKKCPVSLWEHLGLNQTLIEPNNLKRTKLRAQLSFLEIK